MVTLMSSSFFSTFPEFFYFFSAPQCWKSWSEGNRVNLLASNYFAPSFGSLGSGIFRGFTSEAATYVYNPVGGTTLVVGNVCTVAVGNETSKATLPQATKSYDSLLADQASSETLEKLKHPVHAHNSTSDQTAGNSTYKTALPQSTKSHDSLLVGQASSETLKGSDGLVELHNTTSSQAIILASKRTSAVEIGENQAFLHEDLKRYGHAIISSALSDGIVTQVFCHDDNLCCTLKYHYPRNKNEEGVFMLLAYSGLIEKGGGIYSMYSQTCAVVFCLNNNITSCALMEGQPVRNTSLAIDSLSGTFSTPHIYPSVFTQNLELYDSDSWEFTLKETSGNFDGVLNLKNAVENLLSLTLFSRWYAKDPVE